MKRSKQQKTLLFKCTNLGGYYSRRIFFSSLKSELIKKQIYPTRAQPNSEIFAYIEEFYDRLRHHIHQSQLSPMAFEQRQIAL